MQSGSVPFLKKGISNSMSKFFCSIGQDVADKNNHTANPLLIDDYELNKEKTKSHFTTIGV